MSKRGDIRARVGYLQGQIAKLTILKYPKTEEERYREVLELLDRLRGLLSKAVRVMEEKGELPERDQATALSALLTQLRGFEDYKAKREGLYSPEKVMKVEIRSELTREVIGILGQARLIAGVTDEQMGMIATEIKRLEAGKAVEIGGLEGGVGASVS